MGIELRGGKKADTTSPFARFKLRDNPFVSAPVANFAASDPRLRKIFSREAQKAAIERIEARWVGTKLFPERLRVGFLWAQSTDLTDKGMGKSAVLFHIIDRLNEGWGQAYFKDRKVAAIYVYAGTDWNQIGHISIDAMRRLEDVGIIDEVVRVLRYEVLSATGHKAVTGFTSENDLAQLLDEEYLAAQDVDMATLAEGVVRKLLDTGVTEPGLAQAVADRKYSDFLKAKRSDRQLTVPPKAHDWRLTKESFRLFFDQSMRIMSAGKFDACYLFVDDVENIVKNGKTDLRQFAAQLGGALFRDDVYSNTAGFLSVFLTTHAQAAQMLAKEWRECGYQTRAELHTQSENSVMITRLTSAGAEKMIAEYLQFFRSEAVGDPLFPFSKDAVHSLAEKSQYHPAQMLRNCHKVLLQAIDDGTDLISKEFAMKVLESRVDALPAGEGPEAGSTFGGYED
jgi:hypothetical protein